MQNRGFTPTVVENTIQTGAPTPGKTPGTTVFGDPANKGGVVVSDEGRVITVIPGGN